MKKILTLIILIFTLNAYSQNYDKKIVGVWILKDLQINNLPHLAQEMTDRQHESYKEDIAEYTERIFQLEEDIKILTDQEEIDEINQQIELNRQRIAEKSEQMALITAESFMEDTKKSFNQSIGSMKLSFFADKKYIVSFDTEQEGTYSFTADNTGFIIYSNEKTDIFKIKKLNKKKFIFTFEDEFSDINIVFTYTLEREK